MAEPITLLACPFCGGAAEKKRLGCRACSSLVGCTECHAELEANEDAWNTGSAWNVRAGGLAHGTTDGSRFAACGGSAPTQPRVVTSCFDGCGSSHLSETNNYYVCRNCGMTYSKNKAAVTQGPNGELSCSDPSAGTVTRNEEGERR